MDPPPPFDHLHHRRSHPNHNYHHHYAGGGSEGLGARARYDSYEPQPQYLSLDHPHPHHRLAPPPPPPPTAQPHPRHDAPHYPPPRRPPEVYPSPPHHHQHRRNDDPRAAHEMRRIAHHHHHQQQQQLAWEEAEAERRRLAAGHHPRASPPASRKRHWCSVHDCSDLESTSSSGPPPRRPRQQPHPTYVQDENYIDRTTRSGYVGHDGFSTCSDSIGQRKMPMPMVLPGSPHAMPAGYMRRTPQRSAPARVSVWKRIEENPLLHASPPPGPAWKDVHVAPFKSNDAAVAQKESASAISVDGKGISADGNGDSYVGMTKKNEKVLASVLVKASPNSKAKEGTGKKITMRPVKDQKNGAASTSEAAGRATCPVAGVKKVKKIIVIKKVVKKSGEKGKQIVSEKRDNIDMNPDASEKEEGEITMSSFEKDAVSMSNLVDTSDIAEVANGEGVQKEKSETLIDLCEKNAASAVESRGIPDAANVSGIELARKEEGIVCMDSSDKDAVCVGESENSQKEKHEVMVHSNGVHVVAANNSMGIPNAVHAHDGEDLSKEESKIPVDVSENNTTFVPGLMRNPDAVEVGRTEDVRRDDNGSSDENKKIPMYVSEHNAAFVDGLMRNPDTVEIVECEGVQREDRKIVIGSSEESKKHMDMSEANASFVDGVVRNLDTVEVGGRLMRNPDTVEIDGSLMRDSDTVEVGGVEDGNIMIDSSEKSVASVNDFIRTPNTVEVSVRENVQEKQGTIQTDSTEKSIDSLGDSMGTPSATEVGASEDARKIEGNMLIHSNERNVAYVNNSAIIRNKMEDSANGDIQMKEGKMPMESSKTNASAIYQMKTPNTVEVTENEFVQKEAFMVPKESSEKNAVAIDDFMSTPKLAVVGRTEDGCKEDRLLNEKAGLKETDAQLEVVVMDSSNMPSSRSLEGVNVPPLDNDPMENLTNANILNNDMSRQTMSQANELMHLPRIHLFPKNDFSLSCSGDSSSISGNSDQFVATDLTLGRSIYFSSADSGVQHEHRKPVEEKQELVEFNNLEKGKSVTGDSLFTSGVQNWESLPTSVNNAAVLDKSMNNDAFISQDRPVLNQSASDNDFFSEDHSIRPVLEQCLNDDSFQSQDDSIRPCGSNGSQSDFLAPNLGSEAVENQREIVLSGSQTVDAMNVIEQCSTQLMDGPVDNPNEPIFSASQSAEAMNVEQVCSQLSFNLDHSNHINTDNLVVESGMKQDVSSWIESVVSEAKKELEPCKSTLPSVGFLDKLLAPKEDNRKTVLDSGVNFVEKSTSQMNFTSSTLPKVAPRQASLPSPSREPPRFNHSTRRRTWHRDNMAPSASSSHGNSQPSGLPPKLPLKKTGKLQNSYIRSGNSLIRNLAMGNAPYSSSQDTQTKFNKPVMRRSVSFVRKIDSKDFVGHSNISVERPKTPPLPIQTKSISGAPNLLESLSQTMQKLQLPETEKEDPIEQPYSGIDNPSIASIQRSEPCDASRVLYVKHKSNQLVAAQKPHVGDSTSNSMEKVLSSNQLTASDLYLKKRKNQIILSSSSSDGLHRKEISPAENSNSDDNRDLTNASSNNSITGAKNKTDKALQKTNGVGNFSHVWTLSGHQSLQQSQRKWIVATSHVKAFPRILPWKRKLFSKNFRSSHTSVLNKGSSRIVRKLLLTRKRDMIYTVSKDGFSLRKTGVLSIGGSSLKWSRSLEKHSQKVNEEATLAVDEVERRKREKRKRQPIRNKGKKDRYSISIADNQLKNSNQAPLDMRRPSTCNQEYVRVSKGNQLVRNPKKVICMLASEKVRWSLHTVRSRQAKKQQYCQFFTRFGECKKYGGNCPYIHDPAKVTICTKFLKGLCSNTNCKLTHKVLPERMPDCSYFLRGLCTNTACPYRHVNVNPNAPVCEDFLRGYCADGDECHKKHSYVCPVFEATGECLQRPRCKLHHPKKTTKSKRRRVDIPQNSWGRYFDSIIDHDGETTKIGSDDEKREKHQDAFSSRDFVDFISLGVDADTGDADADALNDDQLMELDSGNFDIQTNNLDALIKPLRIMRTARVLSVIQLDDL